MESSADQDQMLHKIKMAINGNRLLEINESNSDVAGYIDNDLVPLLLVKSGKPYMHMIGKQWALLIGTYVPNYPKPLN